MDRNLLIENILLLNPKATHKTYGGKKKFPLHEQKPVSFCPCPQGKSLYLLQFTPIALHIYTL
jgi:hypothetical protein